MSSPENNSSDASSYSENLIESLINPPAGVIDFARNNHYFIPWLCHIRRKLYALGASVLLDNGYLSDGVRNSTKTHLLPGSSKDCDVLNDNEKWNLEKNYIFDKALHVVVESLNCVQIAVVSHILYDNDTSSGEKAAKTVDFFCMMYGTNEYRNTKPIINELKSTPLATDCSSAEYLLASLTYWNNCLHMIHPSAALKDIEIIKILIEKLQSNMFAYVALKIQSSGMLFNDAKNQVWHTIALYRQRALLSEQSD